jgi:hypothetical protein
MLDVKPEDAPSTGQRVDRIELTACPGEFEPFSLCVHGTADGAWMIRIEDLKLKADPTRTIVASAVEVSILWYEQTKGYLGTSTVTDWVLDVGARGAYLEKGRTQRLWLTVHVPESAPPGLYEGGFVLQEKEGTGRVRVPILLDVLPIKLAPPTGVQFYLMFTVAYSQGARYNVRKPGMAQKAMAFYRELKDHGMTCIVPKCSDWPYRPGEFVGLEACVETAVKAGLKGPVVWYMSSLINAAKGGQRYKHYDGKCDNWDEKRDLANLKQIVQEVQKRARQKRWPEIVYMTVDEAGTQTGDRTIRALRMGTILPKTLKVVHELGARACATLSEPMDDKHNRRWVKEPDELRQMWERARPHCDVRIYGYGYPQGKTSLASEKADCRKRGHEMWWYYNRAVMGSDRYAARMYFGLWSWLAEAQGVGAWTYPGGRSVQFELVREGIDDFKYLATLERLIAEKRGSAPDRQAAEAFLAALKKSVKRNKDGYITDWAEAAVQATGARPADFGAFKRRMGALIKALAE